MKRSKSKLSKFNPFIILIFTIFFLIPKAFALPTEQVSLIRQDCTGYTNCFTSLSAWETAKQRDLAALDQIEVAQIEGSWTLPDTTAVTIDGWITDATHYIKIYTTPEARHSGKWDNTKYRLEATSNPLNIFSNYTQIDGLQIRYSGTGNTSTINLNAGVLIPVIKNSIIRNLSVAPDYRNSLIENNAAGSKIYNNIGYDGGRGIAMRWGASGNHYIYNNTVYGIAGEGFMRQTGTVIMKNNISYNNNVNYGTGYDAASTNNLSGPSQTDAPGANPQNAANVTFADITTADFRLSSSDTGAKDTGIDLSTDPNLSFNTDITGEIRSGVWDIGADEGAICEADVDNGKKCYYIDSVNGDDNNSGSFATPWRSFKNIVTYYGTDYLGSTLRPPTWVDINPGDFVYVLDGIYSDTYNYAGSTSVVTYRSKVGSAENKFHLKAYPGHKPIIDPQYSGMGIWLEQSSWWEIDGFEIRNAYQIGIRIASSDIKITNVHIHDTDGVDNNNLAGLRGDGASNIEVSNSVFHDNYDRTNADTNGQATTNSSNMIFFGGGNISVHNNSFYQTPPTTSAKTGECLMYKHAATDPAGYFNVYNNTFRSCKFFAIGTGTQNSHIHHNIIMDGEGISSQDFGGPTHQTNQLFEYNTFYNASVFYMSPTDTYSNTIFSDPQNITFRNNIVYESRTVSSNEKGTIVLGTYSSDALYTKTTPQLYFENNCYYNPNTAIQFNLFAANNDSQNTRPQYGVLGGQYTFSQWKALEFGYDFNSLNENPLFINPANEDFNLQSASPCKNMGVYAALPDTTPPIRSAGSPTGALSSGTTQTTLSLTTDENATCRYSTNANTAYSSMTETFLTTGSTNHSTTLSGLQDGQSYNYYVRCADTASIPNVNAEDYNISFSVASTSPTTNECATNWQTQHPEWLFCDDFEGGAFKSGWYQIWNSTDVNLVTAPTDSAIIATPPLRSGNVSRIHYTIDSTYAHQDSNRHMDWVSPTDLEHVFVRGHVLIPKNTQISGVSQSIQRKLFYLYSSNLNAVPGPNGTGFTITLNSNSNIGNNNTVSMRLGYYLGGYGGPIGYASIIWDIAQLPVGKWVAVELEIQLGTPNKVNMTADGIIRLWLDDVLAYENTSMNFRGESVGVQKINIGNQVDRVSFDPLTVDEYRYWDDVVVSSSRIYSGLQTDITPPIRSNGSPASTLASGTTSTTLSLVTDENAICKYSTVANTAYSSMTGTFSTTGSMNHSTTITGLQDGQSYNYYVRCEDTAATPNINTDDYNISFFVDSLDIIFQDNFNYTDSFNNHGWGEVTAESSISTGAGADGSNALKIIFNNTNVNRQHNYNVPVNTKELWVKFDFKIDKGSGDAIGGAKFLKFFGVRNGINYANSTFALVYETGLFRGVSYGNTGDTRDAAVILNYKDYPINAKDGQWHSFKVHMKYNDNGQNNGAYDVWYDGINQISVTGVNNRSDNNSQYFDYVQIGGWNQYYGGSPYYIYYDNFVMAKIDPDNSNLPPDTTLPVTIASPVGGTFRSAQTVILSVNEPTVTYYTTDGSMPTTVSSIYSAPILISTHTTLKFFSIDTAGNEEAVKTESYIINLQDTISPSVPTNLTATVISSTQINLSWDASTDNVGVTGYKIYRDGALTQTLIGETTIYNDTGLTANTTYTYTVTAYDAAGNESGQSISTSATTQAQTAGTGVIFEDNFDGQADWSPRQPNPGEGGDIVCRSDVDGGCPTAPAGYSAYRVATAGRCAINGKNTLNIDSTNHRGSSGKALTYWNEPCYHTDGSWGSDGDLVVLLGSGYNEIYYRFYIKFQPGWQWASPTEPQQKFTRISHYWGGNNFLMASDLGGQNHPMFLALLTKFNSGTADITYQAAFRYENIYLPSDAQPPHSAAQSFFFGNGNYNGTGTDFFDSGMMGDGNWHSWEFYVKLNSAPGIPDGIHKFWLDGVLIANVTDLAWSDQGSPASPRPLWNQIMVGGNNSNRHSGGEQWHAIDDLVISTNYIGPDYVIGGGGTDTIAPITTASPFGGTYTSTQTVTLSVNEAAVTYYTTDGTTPTITSPVYSSPIQINANTTLKFFSKDTAGNVEVFKTENYTINSSDIIAPTITITSPIDQATVNSAQLTVIGTADDNVGVTSVTVNGVTAALTSTGSMNQPNEVSFSVNIPLVGGANTITVTAQDAALNQAQAIISVIYLPQDFILPTVPADLTAIVISSSQINLSWTASTDNVGVTGYKIYRDGTLAQTIIGGTTIYLDTGLTADTTYGYTITAYDAAGNESAQSTAVSATTLALALNKNRYMAITGVNAGDCSNELSPCLTLQYAMSKMNGGDTLLIDDGVYTGALNSITVNDNPPGGTVSAFTIVKAKNIPCQNGVACNQALRVHFDGAKGATFLVDNTNDISYVKFEGLRWDGVFLHLGGNHNYFKQCASMGIYEGNTAPWTFNGKNNLLEDVVAFGKGRYKILFYDPTRTGTTGDNVCRRCIVRHDWSQRSDAQAVAQNLAGFSSYFNRGTALLNPIVIDSDLPEYWQDPPEDIPGAFYQPVDNGPHNLLVEGGVVINNAFGLGQMADGSSGNSIKDVAMVKSASGYSVNGGLSNFQNILIHNVNTSNFTWRSTLQTGTLLYAQNRGVDDFRSVAYSLSNSVFSNITSGYAVRGSSAIVDGINVYGATTYYPGSPASSTNVLTSNPIYSASANPTGSIKYPVRVEAGSVLSTAAGSGGARIGPRILYKLGKDGTFKGDTDWNTEQGSLWPWPLEAWIQAEMRTSDYASFCADANPPCPASFMTDAKRGFAADNQTLSNYIWGSLGNTVPPFNVKATPGSGSVTLTWDSPATIALPTITGYKVYNVTNGGTVTSISGSGTLTATVNGLTNGTNYEFYVTALDSVKGESGYSYNVYSTPVAGGGTIETTPPITTASPVGGTFTSSQTVILSVNESAVTYYTTDGSTPTIASSIYTSPIQISVTTTLKFFSKDTAGNVEVFKAENYTINSSDIIAPIITITSPIDQATVNTAQLTVIGTANDNVGVSSVTVNGVTATLSSTGSMNQPNEVSYRADITLIEGVNTITVTAQDAVLNRAQAIISVTYVVLQDTISPSVPTNLAAIAISATQINLSWDASTDNVAVTGYKIYRDGVLTRTILGGAVIIYADTGLTANTTYTYTVTAYDAAGNESGQSTIASATTQTQVSNKNRYMATTGVNAGDCSNELSPCLTLQYAMTKMNGGDTLLIDDGNYTSSANSIDQSNFPPSGTSGSFTTIRAKNIPCQNGVSCNQPLKVKFSGNAKFFATNYAFNNPESTVEYIKFFGIRWNEIATYTGWNYIYFKQIASQGITDGNTSPMAITGKYNLLEDVVAFGKGRYKILFYDYSRGDSTATDGNNICRRCVVRQDEANKDNSMPQIAGINSYYSRGVACLNCMVIDSDTPSEWPPNPLELPGAFSQPNDTGNNAFIIKGSIVINTALGLLLNKGGSTGHVVEDLVAVKVAGGFNPLGDTYINRVTLIDVGINNFTYLNDNQINTVYGRNKGITTWAGTKTLTNSIFYDIAENVISGDGVTNDYLNIFRIGGQSFIGSSAGTNIFTSDPMLNGLKYPIRIEEGSPLKTQGVSGTQVGANATRKIGTDGTFKFDPNWDTEQGALWPWPLEEWIKAEMRTSEYTTDAKRGFAADNQTLSNYIWGYLGNTVPPFNVKASPGNRSVTLTWDSPAPIALPNITGYKVYNVTNGGTVTSIYGSGTLTATVNGLTNGTNYEFYVTALDSVKGESGYSYKVSATPVDDGGGDTIAPVTTASPLGGTYTSAQTVTLIANESATTYYTTDGTTPTIASPVYSSPIQVNSSITLKYFSIDTAGNEEEFRTENYIINNPPTISAIADQSTNEDIAKTDIAFTLGDLETPAGNLIIAASSSNTTLLPQSNIQLGGEGTDRTITLTLALNQYGTSTITITVTDEGSLSATSSFVLTVTPVNDNPVAVDDDTYSVNEDNILSVEAKGVLNNDTDPDGGTITAELISSTTKGDVLLNADGSFIYTPKPNFNGSDSFTYKAKDTGGLYSNEATVAITINPVNDAPVLSAIGNKSVAENSLLTIILSATDADTGDTLTYSADGLPPGAVFDADIKTFVWTPDYTQAGTYNVTFTVSDGQEGGTDSETVTIEVLDVGISAGAYFVRPYKGTGGGLYGDGSGSSYINAFNGFQALTPQVWNNIKPGNVLYICGTHTIKSAAEADPNFKNLEIKQSGTQENPIIIDGYCMNGNTRDYAVIDGGYNDDWQITNRVNNIVVRGASWVTLRNFDDIRRATYHGIYVTAKNANTSDIVIENVTTRWNDNSGVCAGSMDNTLTYKVSNVLVKNSLSHDNYKVDENGNASASDTNRDHGGSGFQAFGFNQDGITFENNTAYNNGSPYSKDAWGGRQGFTSGAPTLTLLFPNDWRTNCAPECSPAWTNLSGDIYYLTYKNVSLQESGKRFIKLLRDGSESIELSEVSPAVFQNPGLQPNQFYITRENDGLERALYPIDTVYVNTGGSGNKQSFFKVQLGYTKNITFKNNISYGNRHDSAGRDGSGIFADWWSEDVTITGNKSYNNQANGLSLLAARNITVRDNEMYNNSVGTDKDEKSGIRLMQNTYNVLIENNNIHANGFDGIDIREASHDIVISNNLIRDNNRYGINNSDNSATNITINSNSMSGNALGDFNNIEMFAPTIQINSHPSPVNIPNITVTGTASDDVGVVSVKVNGIAAATLDNYAAWSAEVSLTEGNNTIIAIAQDASGKEGEASISVFLDTILPVTTALPIGGTYTSAQSVSLSCNDGAGSGCTNTYYTTDGTTPTTVSPIYSSPIQVTSSITLKYFSVDNAGNEEEVRTENYIINNPPNITAITDQSTDEDIAKAGIAFTIGDIETLPENLGLSASSSNTTLLPQSNIQLGGTGENRTITLTPALNQFGTSTITITVTDEGSLSATSSFVFTVNPVNDNPVAVDDDTYSVNEDNILSVEANGVLNNDTDDGSITAELVSSAVNGYIVLNADGSFTYTPNANFNGSDSFTYKAKDTGGLSSEATVTITVNPVNDNPVTKNDSYSAEENNTLSVNAANGVLANDSDPDGNTITAELVSSTTTAQGGTISLNVNGSFTYTPKANFHGSDSFTYKAKDTGGLYSSEAAVTITVNHINQPPVVTVTADKAAVMEEEFPVRLTVNASDPDSDPVTSLTLVINGVPAQNISGGELIYDYTPSDGTAPLNGSVNIEIYAEAASGTHTTISNPITVTVFDTMKGDSVVDNFIGFSDLFDIAQRWNTHCRDGIYNKILDFNDDCNIDTTDISLFRKVFFSGPRIIRPAYREINYPVISGIYKTMWFAKDPSPILSKLPDVNAALSATANVIGLKIDLALYNADGSFKENIFTSIPNMPFASAWDTTTTPDGNYFLEIRAYDDRTDLPYKGFDHTAFIKTPFIISNPAAVNSKGIMSLTDKDRNINTATVSSTDTNISANITELPNNQIKAEIIVSALADLHNLSFDITFDPTKLSAVSVEEGSLLKGNGETIFISDIDNDTGRVSIGAVLLGRGAGVNEGGNAANIIFTVTTTEKITSNALSFENADIRNSKNEDIIVSAESADNNVSNPEDTDSGIPSEDKDSISGSDPVQQLLSGGSGGGKGGCFIGEVE